jgi:hypothetical protein
MGGSGGGCKENEGCSFPLAFARLFGHPEKRSHRLAPRQTISISLRLPYLADQSMPQAASKSIAKAIVCVAF